MGADRGALQYEADQAGLATEGQTRAFRPTAGFRRAAVALADAIAGHEGGAERTAAAVALIELARAGERDSLVELLRADHGSPTATWTVACYQIGDLTPSAWRDFGEPIEAVTTLAGCGVPGHVAAELLVSTEGGLRWTALVRTGDRVVFQPLTESTAAEAATNGPDMVSPDTVSAVTDRWAARVSGWALSPDDASTGSGTSPASGGFDPALAVRAISEELANRLDVLVETVGRAASERADKHDREMSVRLADLDERLDRIEAELRRINDRLDTPAALTSAAQLPSTAKAPPPASPRGQADPAVIDLRDGSPLQQEVGPVTANLGPLIGAGTRQAFARVVRVIRQAQGTVADIKSAGVGAEAHPGGPARLRSARTARVSRSRVSAPTAQRTVDGHSRPV